MPGGAPLENNNASKGKPWRDAINWALENHKRSQTERAQALRDIATKLIDNALEGDLPAMKELGDRVEGKPAQAIVGDPDQPLEVRICKMVSENE